MPSYTYGVREKFSTIFASAFGLCLSDWVRDEGLSSIKNASTGERGVDSDF